MQFEVVGGLWVSNEEGRLHFRAIDAAEAAMKCHTKDKVKVQIDGVECGRIGESVNRSVVICFDAFDKADDSINGRLIKDSAWLPNEEAKLRQKSDVGR